MKKTGFTLLLTCYLAALKAQNLYVVNSGNNTIGEYTTSGTTVNSSLISGLGTSYGIAIFGTNLFISSFSDGTVGEYTTSGATVNPSLITGLYSPVFCAVNGRCQTGSQNLKPARRGRQSQDWNKCSRL